MSTRYTQAPVAVVLGTRPEIIKMAEFIALLGSRARVIHTGQHWDHAMSGAFMSQLRLPAPSATLTVGGATRGRQIGQTILGLEEAFAEQPPAAVVVQGDTNTVVGGALAANALSIPLVHVEAGLRSYDRGMPEEHNRVVTDHLADLCLAPTEGNRSNLLDEGIPEARVVVTGNTVVAAVRAALVHGRSTARRIREGLGLEDDGYVMATIHRPENTDDPASLRRVFGALAEVSAKLCPVVVPLHPRTRRRLEEFGLTGLLAPLRLIDPIAYEEFVCLCSAAALTISDSGGLQEEASVWGRPVVVVRR